jgi:hypothetical protein
MSKVELITHHLGKHLIKQIEDAYSICSIKEVQKTKAEIIGGFKKIYF